LNKQIAADLGVTEDTVKIHRSRMMQKAGVSSVAELVRLCDQLGIAAAASTHGS
jgi:FixJ family two-component response regulator